MKELEILERARIGDAEDERRAYDQVAPLRKELDLIGDSILRHFTLAALNLAPPYFWNAPRVSSTYPSLPKEQGEGGLLRHARLVSRLTYDLMLASVASPQERDCIMSAALLHDIFFYGLDDPGDFWEEDPEHPFYLSKILERGLENVEQSHSNYLFMVDEEQKHYILRLIRTHKGPNSVAVELYPQTYAEYLLFQCDYLCSQKWVTIKL